MSRTLIYVHVYVNIILASPITYKMFSALPTIMRMPTPNNKNGSVLRRIPNSEGTLAIVQICP